MTPERIAELRLLCNDNGLSASSAIKAVPELLAEVERLRAGLQYIADDNTYCDEWGEKTCSNYAQKILDGGAK